MPTLTIEGRECFYRDIGEGYPLLLGHSYLWTSEMWAPQIDDLSKQFRCIAPDLWDHGASGHLGTKDTTIPQLAEDYWKLMAHLEISEFAVIGLSVGGMWAAELALRHPEAIKALVLMDTFVGSEPEETRLKYFALLDMMEKERCLTAPLLNQIVPLFFSPQTLRANPDFVSRFRDALASFSEDNIPGIASLGRAIFSRECRLGNLKNLTQPTLILVGKDDIPRPPHEAEQMASLLPNGNVKVIERAGHISSLEQPQQVNALILDFLTNCNLRSSSLR